MRRLVFFIFFLGSLAGAAARDSQYDYVEINTLRQEKDKAQREWQKTTPDTRSPCGHGAQEPGVGRNQSGPRRGSRFSNLEQLILRQPCAFAFRPGAEPGAVESLRNRSQ